jgi:hypothetical protein
VTAKLIRHGGFSKLMDITGLSRRTDGSFIPPPVIYIPFYTPRPFTSEPPDMREQITATRLSFLRTRQDENGIHVYEEDGRAS